MKRAGHWPRRASGLLTPGMGDLGHEPRSGVRAHVLPMGAALSPGEPRRLAERYALRPFRDTPPTATPLHLPAPLCCRGRPRRRTRTAEVEYQQRPGSPAWGTYARPASGGANRCSDQQRNGPGDRGLTRLDELLTQPRGSGPAVLGRGCYAPPLPRRLQRPMLRPRMTTRWSVAGVRPLRPDSRRAQRPWRRRVGADSAGRILLRPV